MLVRMKGHQSMVTVNEVEGGQMLSLLGRGGVVVKTTRMSWLSKREDRDYSEAALQMVSTQQAVSKTGSRHVAGYRRTKLGVK